MVLALVAGEVGWAAYALVALAWLAATERSRGRLPRLADFVAGLLGSRLCRVALLGGWVELGWHLFCERP
jgi:hypothetical protein